MSRFADRTRHSLEDCKRDMLNSTSNAINHVLDNGDGTYSVMYHIVCEFCDYCEEQGDCRGRDDFVTPLTKEDPYELQNSQMEDE